jgi:hypothetical protein
LYSESGLATVVDAVVVGTVKDDTLTGRFISMCPGSGILTSYLGKLKNFFGGGSSTTSATELSTATSAEETNAAAPADPVDKVEAIPIQVTVEPTTIKPMTLDEKKTARKRFV